MLRYPSAVVALVFLACLLSAYPEGPAERDGIDRTGSPINTIEQRCGTCHRGGSYDPDLSIELLEGGERVRSYIPGSTYTLRLATAATGSPAAYGFQAVALADDLSAAGTYGEPPAGFQVTELDGRPYLEHGERQPSSSVEIAWTAPEAGTGTVTIYAAGNAVNGADGSSGDNADEEIEVVTEAAASPTLEPALAATRLMRLGDGRLRIEVPAGAESGDLVYATHDLAGRRLDAGSLAAGAAVVESQASVAAIVVTLTRNGRVAWRGISAL